MYLRILKLCKAETVREIYSLFYDSSWTVFPEGTPSLKRKEKKCKATKYFLVSAQYTTWRIEDCIESTSSRHENLYLALRLNIKLCLFSVWSRFPSSVIYSVPSLDPSSEPPTWRARSSLKTGVPKHDWMIHVSEMTIKRWRNIRWGKLLR